MYYEHACEVVACSDGYFQFEELEPQVQQTLNRYSAGGWELVSVVAGDNASETKVMMFFKRAAPV